MGLWRRTGSTENDIGPNNNTTQRASLHILRYNIRERFEFCDYTSQTNRRHEYSFFLQRLVLYLFVSFRANRVCHLTMISRMTKQQLDRAINATRVDRSCAIKKKSSRENFPLYPRCCQSASIVDKTIFDVIVLICKYIKGGRLVVVFYVDHITIFDYNNQIHTSNSVTGCSSSFRNAPT